MYRQVHISIGPSGQIILDRPGSTRETHCIVYNVPVDLTASTVIRQIGKIVFWPWPQTMDWLEMAEKRQGDFVLVKRNQQDAA